MKLTKDNLDKLFAENKLGVGEALRIREMYAKGDMCQCVDESYAGGYWDYANDLMSEFELKDGDYESAQSFIYDYMKDRWVRNDGLECDMENVGCCENCGKVFHTGGGGYCCFVDLCFEQELWEIDGVLLKDYKGTVFEGCQMICNECADKHLKFVG